MIIYDTREITITQQVKYYNEHIRELGEFANKFDEETLCRIYYELNSFKWDEQTLGEFKGCIFASSLLWYIGDSVGEYKLEKYRHFVILPKFNKSGEYCKTEEEFDHWCIVRLMDELGMRNNPIYKPIFR